MVVGGGLNLGDFGAKPWKLVGEVEKEEAKSWAKCGLI